MTSSIHFKFKSQKEPSRVSFDGTGISVFELKREIISQNRLGDGSEFDLAINNEDTGEEYDDDTTIIPRSTSIIARRLPASRPGKGSATRYISGKMPLSARASSRIEPNATNRPINGDGRLETDLKGAQSEEEKIKAVLNLQESRWREQQEDMATATPVSFNRSRMTPTVVPEHPPPPGYLCYRCREKGHWIQACPTNNDPKFDGRYRVKRSTGIPRSFQKQVDKPESRSLDGSDEDPKLSGVMVNADGDFVIAQPDKASWELYQEKASAAAATAAELAAMESGRTLQSRNLLCPIDNRMFLAPTKTPCCSTTYCNDCITNALIESDFVCPGCNAEGVLLDNLSTDEDAITRIKDYESELSGENPHEKHPVATIKMPPENTPKKSLGPLEPPRSENTKKRLGGGRELADESHDGTKAKRQKVEAHSDHAPDSNISKSDRVHPAPSASFGQSFPSFHYGPLPEQFQAPPLPSQGFPTFNPYTATNNTWDQSQTIDQNASTSQGLFMANVNMPVVPMGAQPSPGVFPAQGNMNFMPYSTQLFPQFSLQTSQEPLTFSNQQRTAFSEPFAKEEDNAYFRQPVNPHRHQGKQRRLRPSDYREL